MNFTKKTLCSELVEANSLTDLSSYSDKFSNSQIVKYFDRINIKLTQAMVYRYTRKNILPSVNNRYYSKNHIIGIYAIDFFKGVLTIEEVGKLFSPMYDVADNNKSIDLLNIFKALISIHNEHVESIVDIFLSLNKDIESMISHAQISEKEKVIVYKFINTFILRSFMVIIKKIISKFD